MNILQILPPLTDSFMWLLRGSARAAIAVVAVLIVRAVFRRRLPARWRYALWIAVPVAMLLPRLPQTPVGVSRYTDSEVVRYVLAFDAATDSAPVTPTPKSTITVPSRSHRFTWQEVGGMFWVTGAVLLIGFWVGIHRRTLRRIRGSAQSPEPDIIELTKECAEAIGLHRMPRIIVSSAIPSPAVTGLFRPQLLLPVDLSERFTPDEIRLMLLHELAHIGRGDLLMNYVATALLALHWFNPLLWLAASRMRTDRESACDASVLSSSSTDQREAYGDTLLKLQAELSAGHGFPAFVGIFENTRRIRDRILRIAAFRRGGAVWGLSAIAITASILACLAADSSAPATTNTVSNATAEQKLQPSLDMRLRQMAVNKQQIEISAFVREISQEDIRLVAAEIPDWALSLDRRPFGKFQLVGIRDTAQLAAILGKLSPPSGSNSSSGPRVTTRSGQRAVIEIIREFRYPIEWKDPDPRIPGAPATPTSFETRNLGVTFETQATVTLAPRPGEPTCIDLEVSPQLVTFKGWEPAQTPGGLPIKSPKLSENERAMISLKINDGNSCILIGDMEIPDENPWTQSPADLDLNEVATHRATILWLITPQVVVDHQPLAPELFTPREWQFTNMPIEQCVTYFTGMSRMVDPGKRGLNIVLGKPPTEVRNVTLDLRRMNLISALEFTAKAAGLRAEVGSDNTVILTP